MTKKEKILCCGLALFVISLLFPPWIYTSTRSRLAPFGQDAGYHSIFTPPPVSASQFSGIKMDTSRLAIEWLIIGTVTGAAYFFTSKKTEPPANKS